MSGSKIFGKEISSRGDCIKSLLAEGTGGGGGGVGKIVLHLLLYDSCTLIPWGPEQG